MALSKEDHGDVKGALGKAMANKVKKATNDRVGKTDDKGWQIDTPKKAPKYRFKTSYGQAGGGRNNKVYGG